MDDVAATLIGMVDGRGPDATIDAVGMEAHGGRLVAAATKAIGLLSDAVAQKVTDKVAVDRLDALHAAVKGVRRGGTASVSGVYGGELDAMPMMEMFDRGVQSRMGQARVRRWTDEILPLLLDPADPLGALDLTTHHPPLSEAPSGYEMFGGEHDGCVKVVLNP